MVKEHMPDIGKTGKVFEGNLVFRVKILDVKQSYGKTRWLVSPLEGSGQEWTERVEIDHETP